MKHEIIQLDQVSEKGYIEFFLKSYTNSATLYTVIYSHIHSGHGKHLLLTLGSSSVKDQNAIIGK